MARSPFYKKHIRPKKNTLAYWIIAFLIWFLRILPRKLAYFIGGICGTLFLMFGKKSRQLAKKNIAIAQDYGFKIPEDLLKKVFHRTGENIVEIIRRSDFEQNKIKIIFSAKETFHRLHAKNKGLIVLAGHIGPFELIPAFIEKQGYSTAVIGRKLFDPRVDNLIVRARQGSGIENIPSNSSALKLIRLLKKGYAVGILADTNTKSVQWEMVPFFGRETRTVSGPVALARATGLPMLPLAIRKIDNSTYEIFNLEPIEIPRTKDKKHDMKIGLQQMNKAIENLIEEAPIDWMWYHPRFKK